MKQEIRVLILEDRADDAELLAKELKKSGFQPDWFRVDSEEAYLNALDDSLDLILADYSRPQYTALKALDGLKESELDIPFIVVTGTIGEEQAVGCMKAGADDYLLKDHLARLGQADKQALQKKQLRDEKASADLRLEKTNEQLKAALNDLREVQGRLVQQERLKALGQMASGIAHDFNNSLTPILGFCELLLALPALESQHPRANHYLSMIQTAAIDAANVVGRLKEFYRCEPQTLSIVPVNLSDVATEAVELTRPKWQSEARAKGIEIKIEFDLKDVPFVGVELAGLRESMANLLINAIDAMPQGGTITIRTQARESEGRISIEDTGTGMTTDVHLSCLEPFFTTKGPKGTGLGLSAVYGVMQRNGGRLDIVSEVGKGTTITLAIPYYTAGQAKEDTTSLPQLRPTKVDEPLRRGDAAG